jgi:16S rRNA C967 or C1407 C5-methylase (RsmB/RsmF family)
MDKPVFERLPKEFVSNMAQTLGEAEARNLCDALMRPPVVSVRMNPSKLCGTDIFDTP